MRSATSGVLMRLVVISGTVRCFFSSAVTQLKAPRGTQSLSNHLRRQLGLDGIKTTLLNELLPRETLQNPELLAPILKALPLDLHRTRPVAEAISSAGGVRLDELDDDLQLRRLPGVFCAGEMLDWEAPTGGYLLTACLASGVRAGRGVRQWLKGGS